MFWNLLSASADTSSSGVATQNPWGQWLMIGVLVVIIIVFMMLNRRSQKKRAEETQNMLNAIKPGNKVKTIGGICGVVVEVGDDNTFVLETGSENGQKSYLRFDKQAVYQTDATADQAQPAEMTPVEEKPVENAENAEETAETETTEETPVENTENAEKTVETETTEDNGDGLI